MAKETIPLIKQKKAHRWSSTLYSIRWRSLIGETVGATEPWTWTCDLTRSVSWLLYDSSNKKTDSLPDPGLERCRGHISYTTPGFVASNRSSISWLSTRLFYNPATCWNLSMNSIWQSGNYKLGESGAVDGIRSRMPLTKHGCLSSPPGVLRI